MNWLPMISMAAQVTLVTAIALAAASWLRSAAHRHNILLAALLCVCASPLFMVGTVWTGMVVEWPVRVSASVVPVATPNSLATVPPQNQSPAPLDLSTGTGLNSAESRDAETIQDQAASAVATTPRTIKARTFPLDLTFAAIWLVGTMFFCIGVIRSSWNTWNVLKALRPLEQAGCASIVAEAERQLGSAVILRVGTSGTVAGPVVIGLIRPWILIPLRYLETLSREELLQVLIHEGAHAVRRDPLVALLQQICRALFWWHPLIYRLNQQLIRAREEVCDNFVLGHVEAVDYGATLLKLATLSPAMARFSMAIGIFDSRESLEDRIRDLLDAERPRTTRVRSLAAATVLGTFVILSVFIAASRVSAQNPPKATGGPPGVAPRTPAKAIDVKAISADPKELRLILTYHGESDKPLYNLTLSVPPVMQQKRPFSLFEPIDEEQAARIIRYLEESDFFRHARRTENQNDPETGPQYLLRVSTGEGHYEETLGWDIGTLLRLDAFRKTFDGNAAQAMDHLLRRLEEQRQIWESGRLVNDLKATLFQENQAGHFVVGEAIPIKLQLTNVGKDDRSYGHHHFIRSGSEIVVHDEYGRRVPYLGGGAGLKQTQVVIGGGQSKIIEDCNLSDFFYLRRPGTYVVSFHSAELPSSNALRFHVDTDGGAPDDGDPMGRLLRLNSSKWTLIGNPNALSKIQPGQNRAETRGWQFMFIDRERGVKGSKFAVWLWLTDKPALEVESREKPLLSSEFLGNIARWYAYIHVSPEALAAWPTVKVDIAEALGETPETSFNQGERPDVDPIRRLQPLVKDGWSLGASSGHSLQVQPGSNWGETTCRIIRFVNRPPVQDGHGLINLWLADQAATAKPVNAISSQPTSEYLGKLDRWHVYYLASEQAVAVWPTAKEDIKARLSHNAASATSSVETSDKSRKTSDNATDEEYRHLHDRYKNQIVAAIRDGKMDELARLTDEFNSSIGGNLLYVQVVSRVGPIAEHITLLSKFYGERKISLGKINYAAATRVHVTQNSNGEGYVLIATNSLAGEKWPDDLQITMAIDPLPAKVGEPALRDAN